jgi:hypothetical protein
MDIFSLMDCEGCDSHKRIPGRIWGEPDSCYPDEDLCREDAPDNGPCERMLGAIGDLIRDGLLELHNGCIHSRDCLGLEDMDLAIWQGFDFSSASYWFFPDSGKNPVPFEDEKAIFKEFFC